MTNISKNPTLYTVKTTAISLLGMLFLLLLPAPLYACDDWVAKVVSVEGSVQRQNPQQKWQRLQYEQLICPGDSVRVGDNSRAALHLRNNTFARLDANSIINFPTHSREDRFWIELKQGLAHFISRIVHQFEVTTPYVNAVVEGTEFIVSARQQGAVSVVEGKVTAYNEKSRTQLAAGEQITAQARDQDLTRLNIPAGTMVEWAIHYPPILTLAELPSDSGPDKDLLQQAVQALQNNRIDLALQLLASDNPSATIQLARAALLLQVGRMAEFDALIATQLQGTQSGTAYGLHSIAAVARNRIDSGKASAEEAVKRAPGVASSWIALSYAQQAALQLSEARDSAHKAVKVQPDSVLAHLRLSELYLAQGDTDGARKALDHLPDTIAHSSALEGSKGFVQLFRLKLESAKEHFNKALAADSGNPQYHLGMGLALLRGGDLEKGRLEMEYAVSLDPLRSVLRSYVGRAYFEEKRDKEAIKQWDLAKQFDPNDPTPYFYTGVYKLFANDPIGAIDELETSRDLNDKRAIYRSETLLQSDAASRSATIARAYDEVGYEQGVLRNGWESVQRDPSNSEGHRLLADHYAGDPRYETARVSELLQSQVWQPLSAYPLQPQLSEADLSVVAGAGPQQPGFNEYHSLFTRDGVYGAVNGYGGSDSTWGDDLVGSFLAGPIAVSLGQYHFESDGWRENADQTQDIVGGLVQWQMSSSTQLQFESRRLDWDKGDLAPRWDGKQTNILYDDQERETQRASLTHRFDPANAMAVSYTWQQFDSQRSQELPNNQAVLRLDQQPKTLEVQAIHLGQHLRWVYGVSSSRIDFGYQVGLNLSTFDDSMLPTFIAIEIADSTDRLQTQDDVYAYAFWSPAQFATFQIGVTYTDMGMESDSSIRTVTTVDIPLIMFTDVSDITESSADDSDRQKWSPKLGLTLDLPSDLSVRMAAFKSMSKAVAAGQTLEPVSVAGFNQFYGDRDGLQSRNLGLAVDYAGMSSIKVGASFVRRLIEGQSIVDSVGTADTHANENLAEVYSFFPLSAQWVILAGYQYSMLNDSYFKDATDGIISARTEAIPVELKWFADKGLTAAVKFTHYRHRFDFIDSLNDTTFDEKIANVVDVKFGYRLPRRLGLVEVGVLNATDEDTEILYQKEAGESYLGFYPARMGYCRLNLNF